MPHVAYDLRPVEAPRLRGVALRLLVALLEKAVTTWLIAPVLIRNLGVLDLRAADTKEPPMFLPLHPSTTDSVSPGACPEEIPVLSRCGPGFRFRSIRDYQRAYGSGAITPEQVAERVLAAISASEDLPKPLRVFIACNRDNVISQAREATRRYKEARTLGLLDGVPIAVKDEVDMVPYPTTAGTRFLGTAAAQKDSTVVARLRDAGALLIGKTNMHEIGILPDGLNSHYGPVRNPYNLAHETGGSSSGSAAAVAAGMCPAAIGADGGGSIRVPAAFCGVVGLKPTFGRVSESGAVPLAWSVAHLGPIAATAEDAALLYAAISGPDPADPNTHAQPPVRIKKYDGSLKGVRIGIYRKWFRDADGDVVAACERVLDNFVRLGAELVEVVIPDLRLIAIAHGLTIHTEMAANMDRYDHEYRHEFGLTTRLMLATVRAVRSSDYVQAQRIRTRAVTYFLSELTKADVIATPTTPITAPEILERALPHGEANVGQAMQVTRFINPANLTGLPAISLPAGYDRRGLPLGLQLIARPWDEGMLFRLAYAADSMVQRQRPGIYFDLLPELGES
jgi:Asp-tRNA(Asn)/Glu-tRNA(Gln) amidotransferase A subunit family amidase